MANYQIKQSSTAYPLVFFMVDSTDHVTGKTGLSPTVTLSKAGGSFASPSGAVTEIANGFYKVAGNATDTGTLGPLALHATATGADPSDTLYEVVAHDVQDSVRLGLTALPNAAASASGGLPTYGTGTGQINPSSGKLPATLAAADVSGNVPADIQTIKTQAVTASSGVTFPSSIGTSTYAGADTSGTTTLLSRIASSLTITGGKVDVNDKTGFSLATNVWDELLTNHQITGSYGQALQGLVAYAGTASTSGGSNSVTLGSGASSADDFYQDCWVFLTNQSTGKIDVSCRTSGYTGSTKSLGTNQFIVSAHSYYAVILRNPGVLLDGFTYPGGTIAMSNTAVAAVINPVTVGTNNDKTGYSLTSGERDAVAAALLDLVDAIEAGVTPRNALKLVLAACAGKISGAGTTTVVVRNAVADTKNRITATVDSDGNRTAITTDLS